MLGSVSDGTTPIIAGGQAASPLPVALYTRVRFEPAPGGLCLKDDETEITLTGIDAGRCRALLDRLDGEHTLQQICEASGLDAPGLTTIVSCLVDGGMAYRTSERQPPQSLTGAGFARMCRGLIPPWKARLFGHGLWRSLSSGDAPRPLFEGWLLQNFHFIEGVTLRLSAAVAHTSDARLRRHFLKHFSEEYDHCEFFRRALAVCGVSEEELRASQPLAGTSAVLNWMRDAARTDPLCYAACSAFLESTGADRQSAATFFQRLSERYEPEAVKLMAEHAHLDEDYGHAGFLEKICGEIAVVEAARAERAVQSLWGLVETLELWSTVIQRHYAEDAGRPDAGDAGDAVRMYGAPRAGRRA